MTEKELEALNAQLLEALEHVTNSFWIVLFDRGYVVGEDENPHGGYWGSIREANVAIAKAREVNSDRREISV